MASPGNQHCANCIGTLSFPWCRNHLIIGNDLNRYQQHSGIPLCRLRADSRLLCARFAELVCYRTGSNLVGGNFSAKASYLGHSRQLSVGWQRSLM